MNVHTNSHIYTLEEIKLKMQMRRLLEDHIFWTRMYIVDLLNNSPSLEHTSDRLLKNQEAIGNFMKSYFGDIAGDNIIYLLKKHVAIGSDLLKSIKTGNTIDATNIEEKWVTNIEEISNILTTINPHYSDQELKDMFRTHLILTKYEFLARMDRDYSSDILYYDMALHQILMLSDYLSSGIIEAFFRGTYTDTLQENIHIQEPVQEDVQTQEPVQEDVQTQEPVQEDIK